MASAFFFDSLSPISSSDASGRPMVIARIRFHSLPTAVFGALAAGLATSWPGPEYRKYAEWGRSTRTRRSAGLRPFSGPLPALIGLLLLSVGGSVATAIRNVGDDRVLASEEGRLQPLGRLVIQHAVPPVAGNVLRQDDDRDGRRDVCRPARIEDVEVGGNGADEGPIWRLDDDQRDARELALPAASKLVAGLGILGHEDGPHVLRQGPPEVDGLDDRPVDAVDGHDHPLLAMRSLDDHVVADVELPLLGVVLAADERHQPDEKWHQSQDEEGRWCLGDRHDDEHDPRQQGAERVDRQPSPPARAALSPPVTDHPALADREVDEHTDGIQRDE